MNKIKLLGVDIGGSHITAAFIDQEKGCIIPETRISSTVESNGSVETILNTWGAVLSKVCSNVPKDLLRIGISMPGPFDYHRGVSLIKNMNKYESLYGFNIREHLAHILKVNPVSILFRNDAESFLHGEVLYGAAKGFKKAIGITIGTGLGSAISTDMITSDVNLGSSLFYNGIAEDYISTRWFIKQYYERTGILIPGVKELVLQNNTEVVKEIFAEFSTNLFVFLKSFIASENPEVIVIGGNIALAHNLFWKTVVAQIKSEYPNLIIRRTVLSENAALMGVAGCWADTIVFSE